jgi:uncharacterized SAM-binding protein YcdF (DUF218 family)
VYLSKLLPPLLLYPPGMSLVLVLLAALLRKRRPVLSAILFITGLGALYLLSTEAVSESLMGSLETQYKAVPVNQAPNADAIVVLGGYLHTPGTQHPEGEFTEAADRLWMGAKLYRAGKAPLVLLTGGVVKVLGEEGGSEGVSARDILLQWSVPPDAILLEQQSQNTRENASFSAGILTAKGAKRLLLVTSASHMPRAMAIFHHAGMDVIPAPTDYQTGWARPHPSLRWIPDAEYLFRSQRALKEWIGLAVYRLRGWA